MNAMMQMAKAERRRVQSHWDAGTSGASRRQSQDAKRQVNGAIRLAADIYGVTAKDIIGRSRLPHLVEARQAAMMFARDEGVGLEDVGAHMDRDHTTVLHGERRARERLAANVKKIVFKSTRNKT